MLWSLKNSLKLTDPFLKTTQPTDVDSSAVSGPNAIRQPSFLAACVDVPPAVESVQVDYSLNCLIILRSFMKMDLCTLGSGQFSIGPF